MKGATMMSQLIKRQLPDVYKRGLSTIISGSCEPVRLASTSNVLAFHRNVPIRGKLNYTHRAQLSVQNYIYKALSFRRSPLLPFQSLEMPGLHRWMGYYYCAFPRSFCTTTKGKQPRKTSKKLEDVTEGLEKNIVEVTSEGIQARKPLPAQTPGTKKRAKRKATSKLTTVIDDYGYSYEQEQETFPITAYAVCEEFDIDSMHKGLIAQGLYIPTVLSDDLTDVIHVSAKYPIGDEPREIFFFREGAVVFWNVPYLERVNVLKFLKDYQDESYDPVEIEEECESMTYTHNDQGSTRLVRGKVYLGAEVSNKLLEKYAFANALASSVKLGIWEATLEKYVEGIERITEALKRAEDIKLSRPEVLQKTGELFALRHELNLNSDLLDTPDFYWDRERLETLYQKTCDYLSVNRRTKVMNEKLTQCCEILDLISSHLTDQHHTRLEWMIIILIMIEVGFEILHLLERYEIVH